MAGDRITGIAELKKRLWKIRKDECEEGIEIFVIPLIDEFEAHWKGEADRLDDGHAKTCKCCNCFVASIYRRILGEGGR